MKQLYLLLIACLLSVSSIAVVAPILGPSVVCRGASITLTDATAGGVWSCDSITIGMVDTAGVFTGIAAGIANVTYLISGTDYAVKSITVNVSPSAILGPPGLCVGTTIVLTTTTVIGAWSVAPSGVATIDASGSLLGIASGTANVTYTIGSCQAVRTIGVHPMPSAISGPGSVCMGSTITLSNSLPGGRWYCDLPMYATIDTFTGVVTSISAGSVLITYTSGPGCSVYKPTNIYYNSIITGPPTVCSGDSEILGTIFTGGTWTHTQPSVAAITDLGGGYIKCKGITVGTDTIKHTTGAGCSTTHVITVAPPACSGTPTAGTAIISSSATCINTPIVLSLSGATSGCGIIYQWQSSTDGIMFSDITGGNSSTYTYTATTNKYFRCAITCTLGGLSDTSGVAFLSIHNSIASHTITNTADTFCNTPHLYISACGVATTFNVTTWFGDETSVNTPLTSTGTCHADIYHTYINPGTYSIKQVLYLGTIPQDTVYSSYEYYYCRTFPLKFFIDANSNCLFDSGDKKLLAPIATEIDSNGYPIDTISITSGYYYSAHGPLGTVFSFRPLSLPGTLHTTCPAGGILYDTIKSADNYPIKYLGLNCAGGSTYDLTEHTVVTATGPRDQVGYIYINNKHCYSVNAVLTLHFSPKYAYTGGAIPAPTSVSGNTLTWNFSGMSSDSTRINNVFYVVWSNPLTGLLAARDTVQSYITITGLGGGGDYDTSNNSEYKTDTVRSSQDPNDIAVSPQGLVIPCTQLQYTIRFENDGNDTARNIYVMDTLSDNLDPRTLNIEMASSAMNIAMIKDGGHNIVKFDLPSINLLDSSHHNECNGTIIFNIKTRPSLTNGTTITNKAGIYFDDNPAVMTNIVENIIGVSAVTGAGSVCSGTNIYLENATKGGIWSSTRPAIASVGSVTGTVTGIAAGLDTIVYTIANSCGMQTRTKNISVHTTVIPAVNIVTSPGDTSCEGMPVLFTATPVNGGATPSYNWAVNGISSGSAATYTYIPANNDIVSATLHSNATCAIPDTSISTTMMTVYPYIAPTINITTTQGTPKGSPDTLKAIVNGSGSVIKYQWVVNGTYIAGATSGTYIDNNLSDNDSVNCFIITSNFCNEVITGNHIVVSKNETRVPSITANKSIYIYPNPNKGSFTIKALLGNAVNEHATILITDMLGHMVYSNVIMITNGNMESSVLPQNQLASGMYLISLHSETINYISHFVVEK